MSRSDPPKSSKRSIADKEEESLQELSLETLKSRYSIYAVFLRVFFFLIISSVAVEFVLLIVKPIGKNTTLNFPHAIDYSFSPDKKSFLALIADSSGLILLSKDSGNANFGFLASLPNKRSIAFSPLTYYWKKQRGIVLAENNLLVKSTADSSWDSVALSGGPFIASAFSPDTNKVFLLSVSDSVFTYDFISKKLTFENINRREANTYSAVSKISTDGTLPETFRLLRTSTGNIFLHEKIFTTEISESGAVELNDSSSKTMEEYSAKK